MARAALAVLVILIVPHGSSAEPLPRIRILDPVLKSLFEHGTTQSPTLRALVEKVEAASILVFVEGGIQMPDRVGARLNFVTSISGRTRLPAHAAY